MGPKNMKEQRVASALLALALPAVLSTFASIAQITALYETPLSARLDARVNGVPSERFARSMPVKAPPQTHPAHFPPTSTLRLTQTQELAAVTSFLASLASNVLPPSVDPAQPIDPQLVLDFQFDVARMGEERIADELGEMVRDVWARNPVFLYSKFHSPHLARVQTHPRQPAPTIIDTDLRDDVEILAPMLERLTGFPELPLLIIGGMPVGSLDEVEALEKSGELAKMITEAGAQVNGAKKKKKRR